MSTRPSEEWWFRSILSIVAIARSDQALDMRADAFEGIDAALPGLVLVVAGDKVVADVADG